MSTIDPEGVLKMVQSKITQTELGHYLISQKENINQICAGNNNFKKRLELQLNLMGRSKRLLELIAHKEGYIKERQTNWHIVPVSLPLLFNPSVENSKLRQIVIQVLFLLLFLVISCDGVQIQTTRNSVLIKSSIPTIELCSTTEEIEMTIFEDFFKQIMKLSQKIEHLADFQPNPNCRTERLTEDIGNILNSNLTKKIIGNIKISHIENKMEKLQYIVWYNDNCYFSLNEEFRKSIRNFNRYVTEGKDAKATRKLMIQNFSDKDNSDCLIHGKYPKKYYTKTLKLNSIVDCALLCNNMYERAIRKEILGDSIEHSARNETCRIFSFNIKTGQCALAPTMSNNIFRSLNDFSGSNEAVVSGKHRCQHKELDLNPKVTYNNSILPINNVCDYTIRQPKLLNSRCMTEYYQLIMPLDFIKNEMKFFVTKIKLKLTSHKRVKRSLIQISGGVIRFLAEQLLKRGNTRVNSEIILNFKQNTVLFNIANTYQNMGFRDTLLTKNSIKKLLEAESKLYMSKTTSYKSTDKIQIEQEIRNLAQWANKIKIHFEKLLFPQPSKNETLAFVGNDTYLFNVWWEDDKIIRKFIKEKKSNYKAKIISYIPINEMYFDSTKWQQHTFLVGNKNACLKALLNGDLSYCTENTSTKQILTDEVFFVNHQYSENSGKIVTFNTKGIIEIKCLLNKANLIKNIKGFTVLLITDDCVLFFNHIMLISAQNNITGMEPVVAYEGLSFITKIEHIEYHNVVNSGLIGVGLSVAILVVIIKYKKESIMSENNHGDYVHNEEIECM